jgi:hypothetical protein
MGLDIMNYSGFSIIFIFMIDLLTLCRILLVSGSLRIFRIFHCIAGCLIREGRNFYQGILELQDEVNELY